MIPAKGKILEIDFPGLIPYVRGLPEIQPVLLPDNNTMKPMKMKSLRGVNAKRVIYKPNIGNEFTYGYDIHDYFD